MHRVCTVSVRCRHNSVQCLHSVCTMIVQCLYSDCTMSAHCLCSFCKMRFCELCCVLRSMFFLWAVFCVVFDRWVAELCAGGRRRCSFGFVPFVGTPGGGVAMTLAEPPCEARRMALWLGRRSSGRSVLTLPFSSVSAVYE